MHLVELPLAKLRLDERCQARAEFSEEYAEEIAEYLRQKDDRGHPRQVPPVIVFHDGTSRWLADGYHRHEAHKRAGRKTIVVDVKKGTLRDAVLFAAGANRAHGLKRTHPDKRRAALLLLMDSEWARWPNLRIADHCGVSEGLVRTLREQLAEMLQKERQEMETYKRDEERGTFNTNKPLNGEKNPGEGSTIEKLANYRRPRKQVFREMAPEDVEKARQEESARHRPAWKQEAHAGLASAQRSLACLGETHKAPLEHVEQAAKAMKKADKADAADVA